VTYSACTEDVCHVVKQTYRLHRQRDKDGGVAPGAGFRGLTAEAMVRRVMAGDKNGDGKLSADELDSLLKGRLAEFDVNKDGALDKDEIQKMASVLTARIKQ
jgi:hypothetical protein